MINFTKQLPRQLKPLERRSRPISSHRTMESSSGSCKSPKKQQCKARRAIQNAIQYELELLVKTVNNN